MRYIRTISLLCFVLILTGLTIPSRGVCQSIESAREKFLLKEYEEALSEIEAVLEADSENLEAIELLKEVELISKQRRAEALTQRALAEIENRRFEQAYGYLEQAILIDPDNQQARRLFLSLHEVGVIEEESVAMVLEEQEKAAAATEDIISVEEGGPGTLEKEAPEPRYDTALVKVSTSYTFANSNRLDYIDGRVSMIGARIDGRYYFDFWERRVGVSLDYIAYPLKTYGDSRIKFVVHRANASARIRTYFFEEDNRRLIVGGRLSYHFFTLQNLMTEGVYNFKQIYGPSLGVFVSDPVVYRFVKNDFFKNFGLEGEFNYLFLIGQGTAPSSLEMYLGAYYNLDRYRFSLGYRLYSISKESINESYSDIEISAGYRF
jgi:tetratricopeptide (TPR) repeat protein